MEDKENFKVGYLMAIDIGTRMFKAIIYDYNGEQVSTGSHPFEASYFLDDKHPEWAFWEPHKVWDGVSTAIREAVSKINNPNQIKAITVTGIGMDGLPIDKSGKELYPFISWHCSRTVPYSTRWINTIGAEEIFRITGNQVLAINSIYRLMWVKENRPDVFQNTFKWLLIEDYINYKLCGSMVTDYSMASTTSVFDQKTRKWSSELLNFAEVDESILPDALPSGTVIGKVHKEAALKTNLAEGIPIVLGGHDYMCAALSVGAYKPGFILDIAGSWEMVLSGINEPLLNKNIFNSGFSVSSHVARGKYAVVGEAVSANMLDWFKNIQMNKTKTCEKQCGLLIWDDLMKKAEKAECIPKGVFFLPHCSGSGSPNPDSRSAGAFIGLNDLVEDSDFIRALVEGLNYQFRDMVESITTALQIDVSKIVSVGEESHNSFITQNKADIIGKIIEVPDIESATCLGAAILAGIGIGVYKDENDANQRTFKSGRIYEPRYSTLNYYNKGFKIYKKLYSALREINWEIFNNFRMKDNDYI
jgi:xylulokinase